MARSGFVAKGTVYVLLGVLGVRAALSAEQAGSTHAALVEVVRAPLGRWLLGALAAGLVWYAVWRFIEAIGDANGKGREPKGLAARAIYLASGGVYAALALDALALAFRWDNDSGQVRSFLAPVLAGPVAVAAALVLIVYGGYHLWKGAQGKLGKQLNERSARREAGAWAIAVSRVGLAGRGVVFGVLGVWLLTHPGEGPSMASDSGAGGALRLIERLPQGELFMGLTAVALMAYGAHQFLHARYRRINVP
jgi:hypothetical protein